LGSSAKPDGDDAPIMRPSMLQLTYPAKSYGYIRAKPPANGSSVRDVTAFV
jgi:hypothetical protein